MDSKSPRFDSIQSTTKKYTCEAKKQLYKTPYLLQGIRYGVPLILPDIHKPSLSSRVFSYLSLSAGYRNPLIPCCFAKDQRIPSPAGKVVSFMV